jgi:hypothetical protein
VGETACLGESDILAAIDAGETNETEIHRRRSFVFLKSLLRLTPQAPNALQTQAWVCFLVQGLFRGLLLVERFRDLRSCMDPESASQVYSPESSQSYPRQRS